MDGCGRAYDNIFVERLWRSVKYEDIYLNGYAHLSNSRLRQAAESVTTFYGDQNWIGDDQALATKEDASKYLSKNASNMSKEELPTDD